MANGVVMGNGKIPERAACEINKDAAANTWTYTFSGINDTIEYYVWEEVPEGYTSDTDPDHRKAVGNGTGTLTITNTAPDLPRYGSLRVSKHLSAGEGAVLTQEDYARAFLFTVTLTDENNDPVRGTRFFGDVPFRDGVAAISVTPDNGNTHNGVTVTDIPQGWHYSVAESAVQGFDLAASVNDSGTVAADAVTQVDLTNRKQAPVAVDLVDVRLKKTVVGSFGTVEDEFSFIASFTDLIPGETYEYLLPDGVTTAQFSADRTGSADLNLKLSADKSMVFRIPEGSCYRFMEAGGDYFTTYSVVDAQDLGRIGSSAGATSGKQQALATAIENADPGEEVTVTFTNRIYMAHDITLGKVVAASAQGNNDPFSFVAIFAGLEPYSTVESDVGTLKADGSGCIEVEFVMTNGKTVHFYSLPVTSTYQIIERANSYAASYTVTDVNLQNKIASPSGTNGYETQKDLSTAVETVDQGEDAVILFTSGKYGHDVKVTKYVDMTYGEHATLNYRTQEFRFRVDLNNLVQNRTYTLAYTSEEMTGEIQQSFTAAGATDSVEVKLKHGETVTIRDLSEGMTYQVTELFDENAPNARNFIPSYTINANEDAIILCGSDSALVPGSLSTKVETVNATDLEVNIVFTNEYVFDPYVLPASGFEDQRMTGVIAIIGMGVFAGLFIISGKRRKKSAK